MFGSTKEQGPNRKTRRTAESRACSKLSKLKAQANVREIVASDQRALKLKNRLEKTRKRKIERLAKLETVAKVSVKKFSPAELKQLRKKTKQAKYLAKKNVEAKI